MWLSESFTRAQAWVDLLMLANHKIGHIRRRGIRVTVNRGQVGYSQEALASRWSWSKGKVIRFLSELKTDERITVEMELKNIAVTALITILNYDQYQGDSTEDDTENGPKTEPKTVPEQECKEGKEEKQQRLSPQQVKEQFLKYAGVLQLGGGQMSLMVDISESYPAEVIIEAFQAGAAANKRGPGFLGWCIARMKGKQAEVTKAKLDPDISVYGAITPDESKWIEEAMAQHGL